MSKKIVIRWSKPYHGISHMEGTPQGTQITVTKIASSLSRLYVLKNGKNNPTNTPFTPVFEFHGTNENCKTIGEGWAIQQGIV